MTRIQFSMFNLPDTSSIISRILVHPDKQIRLNWLMTKTSFGACQRLRIASIFESEWFPSIVKDPCASNRKRSLHELPSRWCSFSLAHTPSCLPLLMEMMDAAPSTASLMPPQNALSNCAQIWEPECKTHVTEQHPIRINSSVGRSKHFIHYFSKTPPCDFQLAYVSNFSTHALSSCHFPCALLVSSHILLCES